MQKTTQLLKRGVPIVIIGMMAMVRVLSFSSRPMTMLNFPSTSSSPNFTMWPSS